MRAPTKVCQKQIFAEGFDVYTDRLLSNQTFTEGLEVCTDEGRFVYSRIDPIAGKLRVAYMCQHTLIAPVVRVQS
jgi:hypothetical protein